MNRERSAGKPHQKRIDDTGGYQQVIRQSDDLVRVPAEQLAEPSGEISGEILDALHQAHKRGNKSHTSFSGIPNTVRSSAFPLSVRNILLYAESTAFIDAPSSNRFTTKSASISIWRSLPSMTS